MSLEETLRLIVREELERREDTIAKRVAEQIRSELAGADDDDRLLKPGDIKPATGYSPETVKRWVREGKLKRYGTERGWRVSRRELKAFLDRSELPADAGPSEAQILEMAKKKAARG